MFDYDAVGHSRAVAWECKKCGFENKAATQECKQCGHEPTLGRRDVELQKWNDSHRQED
jgi:uncharacterized membrane protein YvbJ